LLAKGNTCTMAGRAFCRATQLSIKSCSEDAAAGMIHAMLGAVRSIPEEKRTNLCTIAAKLGLPYVQQVVLDPVAAPAEDAPVHSAGSKHASAAVSSQDPAGSKAKTPATASKSGKDTKKTEKKRKRTDGEDAAPAKAAATPAAVAPAPASEGKAKSKDSKDTSKKDKKKSKHKDDSSDDEAAGKKSEKSSKKHKSKSKDK
jgi:hypothetical protein